MQKNSAFKNVCLSSQFIQFHKFVDSAIRDALSE